MLPVPLLYKAFRREIISPGFGAIMLEVEQKELRLKSDDSNSEFTATGPANSGG